jgi:ribosomal protein S18 acetylase RimI-like enzyme
MPDVYAIRRADSTDAAIAVSILREAALWSSHTGQPTWRAEAFTVAAYEAAADAGELVLGYKNSDPVACMLLQRRDDVYWSNDPVGEAWYVHKVAVRRTAAGEGWVGRLVHWAAQSARRQRAQYLRLDTLNRPKLLALYRGLGFYVVDSYALHSSGDAIVRLQLPLSLRQTAHRAGEQRPS